MSFVVSGCSQQYPPGMPKLYPATITVIQDGQPLVDAQVVIINDDPAVSWSAGGNTDKNGRLKLRTLGQYDGAPLGKYKVGVEKMEYPDIDLPLNPPYGNEKAMKEYQQLVKDYEDNTFILVDRKYSLDNTALSIEITPGNLHATVDVSPAIRKKAPPVPKG
ncbi:MAG: carboxypeptidase-like regulatory domain-containing protein [Planctomycetaceae bacterium]|nr:carboxypeptidase-like regulatory domain-containing protein [Planctomycetaceae bacterium]